MRPAEMLPIVANGANHKTKAKRGIVSTDHIASRNLPQGGFFFRIARVPAGCDGPAAPG